MNRAPTRQQRAFPIVLLLVVVGTVLTSLATAFTRGADEAILILTGACALIVVTLPMLFRRDYNVGEPLSFVAGVTMVGFTLKTIYIVYATTEQAEWVVRFGRQPEYFLEGAFWSLVGLGALVAGYLTTQMRLPIERLPLLSTQRPWSAARLWGMALVLGLVATASAFAYVQLMGISVTDLNSLSAKRLYYIEGAKTQFGSLASLVWGVRMAEYMFYFMVVWVLVTRKSLASMYGVALAVLGGLALFIPLVSSSRQSFILVFINAFLIVYYIRGRVGSRAVFTVAVLGMVALMALTALRRNDADDLLAGGYSGVEDLVDQTVGSRHFSDVSRTSHIVMSVPEKMDYRYGETLITWIAAPIPRVLWKNKPFMGIGKEVAIQVFGYDDRRGVPPGLIGELVINFGVWAIPLGMFLYGALLRIYYLSFVPVLKVPNGALVYVLLLHPMTFAFLNNEVSQGVIRVVFTIVPILVITLVLQGRSGSRAIVPRPRPLYPSPA